MKCGPELIAGLERESLTAMGEEGATSETIVPIGEQRRKFAMRLHSIADRSGRGTVHSHKVDKIATTASLIPAIRAARIEPITAIRHE